MLPLWQNACRTVDSSTPVRVIAAAPGTVLVQVKAQIGLTLAMRTNLLDSLYYRCPFPQLVKPALAVLIAKI